MSVFLFALAVFLLANLTAGLFRIMRGPTAADRMLAAQLFSTTGIAVMLLLGEATGVPAAQDAALIVAVLAVLSGLAFVRRVWGRALREGR